MLHAPLALSVPLAAVLLALAVPTGLTGLRAARGQLDRLGRPGLHTPAARASDEAFSLANRVAAPLTLGAAAVGILCAALVLALPIGVWGAVVVAVLGSAGFFGQLTAASRLGEQAARTVPLPARKPAGGGCCGGCGDAGCSANAGAPAHADARLGHGAAVMPDLVADTALR